MKNQISLRFPLAAFCSLLVVLLIGLVPAFAAPPKKPAGPPPPPTDMRKMIQSVDAANNEVVILYKVNKATHTYRIDGVTTLNINGNPGKFSDIKAGMEVKDYTERDNDDLDSLTLTGS
jgi:hypothetical protein